MKRKIKPINVIFLSAMCLMLLFNIVQEISTTFKVKYDISQADKQSVELKEEHEKLKKEVYKLSDENYIQSYVSGTIFSTEKGTNVYILPDKEAASE